jgi:dihydropyrimidinase
MSITNCQEYISFYSSNPLAVVTSDHRAFKTTEPLSGDFTKMTRGVAAVEERMAVAWERSVYAGHMDHMRFVAVTSSNPAKLLNIYPKKVSQ